MSNYLNVYAVETYKKQGGAEKKNWTKIGVAFPHKDGEGYNLKLTLIPAANAELDLVILPPKEESNEG